MVQIKIYLKVQIKIYLNVQIKIYLRVQTKIYLKLQIKIYLKVQTKYILYSPKLSDYISLFVNNVLNHYSIRVIVLVVIATFNNISAILWWQVLLVEETGVPGENHRPAASH